MNASALARLTTPLLLAAMIAASLAAAGGCHTPSQCPILQGMTGGNIPPLLPPSGSAYEVVGRRDGIRFYVVKYTDQMYRGGDLTDRRGFEALRTLGVRTIISNNPSGKERDLAKEFGFGLVEIPFGWYDMNEGHLARFLEAVDKGAGPYFVHSWLGINQAGVLMAHYRIHRQGWTADRAIDEMYRLDANIWDCMHMEGVLRRAAKGSPKSNVQSPK
jgi:hypothetical protein